MQIEPADDTETFERISYIRELIGYFAGEAVAKNAFVSDESYLADFYVIGDTDEQAKEEIWKNFPRKFDIDMRAPIYQVVDRIRAEFPGWNP